MRPRSHAAAGGEEWPLIEERDGPPPENDASPPSGGPAGGSADARPSASAGAPGNQPQKRRRSRRRGRRKRNRSDAPAGTPASIASANAGVAATPTAKPVVRPPAEPRQESMPPAPVRHPHPQARRYGEGDRRAQGVYAALDLGTNNCRLLVAMPQERGFRVVDAFSRIIRLGEGVSQSGFLAEAAMDRAVEALKVCRAKMEQRQVERSRLIATEACRAAGNSDEFLARVASEAGLNLEIVDRETEARLAVAGCASLVDPNAESVILFDIGGGSSELVWLDFSERRFRSDRPLARHIRAWTSLPIGVVGLSERHGGVHVTPETFEAMVADVRGLLAAFPNRGELAAMLGGGRVHMLGTSGTVTTLAGVHLGLERYDRRRVDGLWMNETDVAAMIGKLLSMSFEERVASPCIGAERADLVLAGCAILEAVRREWPCRRLRVADRGLREGILTELMAADGVWRRRRNRRGNEPRGGASNDRGGAK
ncbi:MAG: Ppx/GppA family phosphatase [Hyphomicrobiales bacterium]